MNAVLTALEGLSREMARLRVRDAQIILYRLSLANLLVYLVGKHCLTTPYPAA